MPPCSAGFFLFFRRSQALSGGLLITSFPSRKKNVFSTKALCYFYCVVLIELFSLSFTPLIFFFYPERLKKVSSK